MECPQMKDFSEFCEQLNEIRVRFHKWDSCERTVALYYLMVGLPFANAKFLQHALEQCIMAVSTPESQVLERNANNPAFISNLLTERPQVALSVLLSHLPLLRPGNKETADCYLLTIRKVLLEFITPPYKIYNECVEIMSYVFIHPAFGKEDKKTFKQLLKQVVNKVCPENFIHSPMNESSDESLSPNPENLNTTQFMDGVIRENRRSNSLTTGQTSSHENLAPSMDFWASQENLSPQGSKPRSYSLSSDKTINLPHSLQLSSSETRLQDLQTINNLPVMKSIVSWLKSLRLHKYSWVFNNLSYEQMMNLTEESLQSIGITKGARHKLLLSIAKLKERSKVLTELETEVLNGGDVLVALKKLKGILQSPLLVTNGEDLPSQFVKVMGKVCTQMLMMRQAVEECVGLFVTISERADSCDAFTPEHKRRFLMWKNQLSREFPTCLPGPQPKNGYTVFDFRYVPNSQSTYQAPTPGPSVQQFYNYNKSSSYPNVQNNQVIGGHRHSIGSITLNNVIPPIPTENICKAGKQSDFILNPSNNQNHVRFQDTELSSGKKQILKNIDIESSLESLCLQMMEHALGP